MTWIIPENITWKNLESGVVLLDLTNGAYYTLNETASLIWRGIIAGRGENDLTTDMIDDFACGPEEAMKDIRETVQYFIKENLLKVE